jgi:hypothetical protein
VHTKKATALRKKKAANAAAVKFIKKTILVKFTFAQPKAANNCQPA